MKNFKWIVDIWGVFWVRLTIYMQKRSFWTLSYEKKCTQTHSHIPCGYTQVLTRIPSYPIKAMELQKSLYRRKELTLICICDIIIFQKKVYIESYIYITKSWDFRNFNIKLRQKCVVSGKSEDDIVSRTQFHTRICKNFEIIFIWNIFFASSIKKCDHKKMCNF